MKFSYNSTTIRYSGKYTKSGISTEQKLPTDVECAISIIVKVSKLDKHIEYIPELLKGVNCIDLYITIQYDQSTKYMEKIYNTAIINNVILRSLKSSKIIKLIMYNENIEITDDQYTLINRSTKVPIQLITFICKKHVRDMNLKYLNPYN